MAANFSLQITLNWIFWTWKTYTRHRKKQEIWRKLTKCWLYVRKVLLQLWLCFDSRDFRSLFKKLKSLIQSFPVENVKINNICKKIYNFDFKFLFNFYKNYRLLWTTLIVFRKPWIFYFKASSVGPQKLNHF